MLRMLLTLILVLVAGAALPVTAQVRYKDTEGITHWVDSLDQVPDQFRSGAAGKSTPPPPPTSSQGIDWDRKAREIDQRKEQETRAAEKQAEQARAAAERAGIVGAWDSAWERAVRDCAATNPERGFDAHVSAPSRVAMIGSARGTYAFRKCMADAGHPTTTP